MANFDIELMGYIQWVGKASFDVVMSCSDDEKASDELWVCSINEIPENQREYIKKGAPVYYRTLSGKYGKYQRLVVGNDVWTEEEIEQAAVYAKRYDRMLGAVDAHGAKHCINCRFWDPVRTGLGECQNKNRTVRYMYSYEICDEFE